MIFKHLITIAGCVLLTTTTAYCKENIKVLIVDGQNNHNWKQTTPIMKSMLEESGLFTVSVATSPAKDVKEFKPSFKDYDAVILNYNGAIWPEETCKAFETYVREGGGVVVIHAADNSFANWAEYNKIIGLGGWGGRNEKSGPYVYYNDNDELIRDESKGPGGGHGPQQEFVVRVRNADHLITKGLPSKWRHGQDELYHMLRGPAENITILATAFSPGTKRHEPVLFTIKYGKGSVYHDVFGHGDRAMSCAAFQTTLLRGTEWAATGKVTQKVPEDFPKEDKAVYRQKK